jgi:hypothetical protein
MYTTDPIYVAPAAAAPGLNTPVVLTGKGILRN